MNQLPFNACDYRCDRCLVSAECAVYQKSEERSLEHSLNGEDEDDLSVVLDDIHNSFEESKAMLRAGAEKFGIDIDDLPEDYYEEEQRRHEASKTIHFFAVHPIL